MIHRRLLSYANATRDNLEALRLLRQFAPEEHFHEAIFLNNLGRLRAERGENGQSAEAYQQVIALAKRYPTEIPRIQLGTALYSVVGVLAKAGNTKATEAAIEAYGEFAAAGKVRQPGSPAGTNTNSYQHGAILSMLGDTTLAIQHFKAAWRLHNADGERKKAARAASNLAQLSAARRRYSDAVNYGRRAIEQAGSDLETIDFTLPILSTAYAELGRWDSAYYFLARHRQLLDSTAVGAQRAQIAQLEVEYATLETKSALALQQAHLDTLSAQRSKLAGLLLAALALLVAVLVFFRQRLKLKETINQQQAQLLEAERREHARDQHVVAIRNMVLGQETERRRIAQDLHDGLSGMLMSAKAHLASPAPEGSKKSSTRSRGLNLLDEAYGEVRRISHALMPQSLHLINFSGAITDLADGLLTHGITPQVVMVDEVTTGLPAEMKLTVYRILQELMANTIKHAHASEVLVQLQQINGQLVLLYEDDGVGFAQSESQHTGLGLTSIESRVALHGGTLDLRTTSGEGVSYMIELPIGTGSASSA